MITIGNQRVHKGAINCQIVRGVCVENLTRRVGASKQVRINFSVFKNKVSVSCSRGVEKAFVKLERCFVAPHFQESWVILIFANWSYHRFHYLDKFSLKETKHNCRDNSEAEVKY
jgi:hypothetical protein